MSVRVSPTEKIRHEIDALFTEGIDLAKTLEQVARLGARLIIQTAVEAEVEEFLGRARYQRVAQVEDARAGSRPAVDSAWDFFPVLGEVLPWSTPGVAANRTWVFAPSRSILQRRWRDIVSEPDPARKAALFKESRDATLAKAKDPLPGRDTYAGRGAFLGESGPMPAPVQVGYRSFDRQWAIPDARLFHAPRPPLWEARSPGQVFVVEQHADQIDDGPGLVFSALIPDMHHFNNRGGRTLPFLYPDGSPNLAPGLVRALSATLGHVVSAPDVLAYVAGVVAHPAFTRTFADELTTPGIRVPLTTDPDLWAEAVTLGEQVVWLHTYGETFIGPARPHASIRYPKGDARQPLSRTPITAMPEVMTYDPARAVAALGDGDFGPVTPEVWDYAVGGKNVLKSWFNYRKKVPGGKKTSPLDYLHVDVWDADWTTEFVDLLTVLTRLVELEPVQADVLERILAAPLLTMDGLTVAGVRWPAAASDRKPRRGIAAGAPEAGQLEF